MFSANISGQIKRVVFDNEEEGKDAMLKIVIEARKQFAKKDDMPNVYPLITIWGHDAAYVRDYAGVGHWIEVINCDLDVYRGEDDEQDRISFKAGKVNLLPKVLSEAVSEVVGDDDEEEDRKKKKKKKSSRDDDKKKGKSRSERRKKPRDDEDEDEDEEDEKPRKKSKAKGKASDGAKKKGKASSKKPSRRDDDDDEDYDEDYDDDDDDDYFDDED